MLRGSKSSLALCFDVDIRNDGTALNNVGDLSLVDLVPLPNRFLNEAVGVAIGMQ